MMGTRNLAVGLLAALASALTIGFAGQATAAPNASFTARPIQGSTCLAPCAVHFDAVGQGYLSPAPYVTSETTDSDSTRPFHSLLFEWDFDDNTPQSCDGVDATWAHSGIAKNYANGGLAGHTYCAPGTYTVTLTVTAPDGEVGTTQRTVTVTGADQHFSDSDTYCFAQSGSNFRGCPLDTSGDGVCDGASAGNCISTGDLDDAINNRCNADSSQKRCLFARGDTFVASSQINFADDRPTPGLVDAFGTGSKPVFAMSGNAFFPGDRWTIANVVISAPSEGWFVVNGIGNNSGPSNVTGYNLDITGFTAACMNEFVTGGYQPWDVGTLHALIEVNCSAAPTVAYGGWPGARYALWMGGSYDKNNSSGTGASIRTTHMQHYIVQHMKWQEPTTGWGDWFLRAYDEFAGRYGHPGSTSADEEANQFVLFSDNWFDGSRQSGALFNVCNDSGCNCLTDPSCSAGGAGHVVDVHDFIWERNFFSYQNVGGVSDGAVIAMVGSDMTVRSNIVDLQGATTGGKDLVWARGNSTSQRSGNTGNDRIHVYNNTTFTDDNSSAEFDVCRQAGDAAVTGCDQDCVCRNNLFVHEGGYAGDTNLVSGPFVQSNNRVQSTNPFLGATPGVGQTDRNDFRLASSSSGIVNAGYDFSAMSNPNVWVHDDAFGNCRSTDTNASWDIGAHEFGADACTPGVATPQAPPAAPVLLP